MKSIIIGSVGMLALTIAFTAGIAAILSWAENLAAKDMGWPSLSFQGAFGIVVMLMIFVTFIKSNNNSKADTKSE